MVKEMEHKNFVRGGFGVLVFREGKLLLGKRHDDAVKADSELHGEGTWCVPGGKMHFQETFEEAAKRELQEETGIIGKKFEVICVSNDRVHDAHFVTIGLLCKEFSGEAKVMEPDEIIEWKWFSPKELPKPMYLASEKVIKNYLEKKFYKY